MSHYIPAEVRSAARVQKYARLMLWTNLGIPAVSSFEHRALGGNALFSRESWRSPGTIVGRGEMNTAKGSECILQRRISQKSIQELRTAKELKQRTRLEPFILLGRDLVAGSALKCDAACNIALN